jgi:small-conductance mechanosensitive channel
MSIFSRVKTDNITNKQFSYSKGKVTLNFTLRIDIKSELKDFLELLKVAKKEVEEEIKK